MRLKEFLLAMAIIHLSINVNKTNTPGVKYTLARECLKRPRGKGVRNESY